MGRVGGRVIFKYWSCAIFLIVSCLIYSRASGMRFPRMELEKDDENRVEWNYHPHSLFLITSKNMHAVKLIPQCL